MNSTNTPAILQALAPVEQFWTGLSPALRVAIIIGLAFFVHFIARLIRQFSEWLINKSHARKNPFGFVTHQPKFITLTRLIVSAVTFVVYALAIYLILIVAYPTATANTFKTYLTS